MLPGVSRQRANAPLGSGHSDHAASRTFDHLGGLDEGPAEDGLAARLPIAARWRRRSTLTAVRDVKPTVSDLRLLGDLQGIIDLDAQVSHGTFHAPVTQQ
jgi:hypothetical protein